MGVEKKIRSIIQDQAIGSQPIQFLVVDIANVDGVDFSAAEAFTRVKRLLSAQGVRLILCGFSPTSKVGKSLYSVGLLDAEDGIEYFENLNQALEFCENELLKAFYQRKDRLERQLAATRSQS